MNIKDPKGVKFAEDTIEGHENSKSVVRANETTYIDLNISQDNVPEYMVHWQTLTNRLADINTNISQLLTAHEE